MHIRSRVIIFSVSNKFSIYGFIIYLNFSYILFICKDALMIIIESEYKSHHLLLVPVKQNLFHWVLILTLKLYRITCGNNEAICIKLLPIEYW